MSDSDEYLHNMRHTLAHILAMGIREVFGTTTRLGVGPVIENGFYYDVMVPEGTIREEDLPRIEKAMRKIVARKLPMTHEELTRAQALKWAEAEGQPFKQELIKDLPKGEAITLYTIGDFTDLCRGGHVEDTGKVGAFKLTKVAGAYWRGDEKREMMQRVYGVAFATQEELDAYLKQQEEARARDHRKLGRELDLFTFSDLVGAGLPLFTPRGTVLREKLAEYSVSLRERAGFERVWTPHITKTELYKVSGHLAKFGEGFAVEGQISHDKFMMKPMNCPHHTQIFASKPRTYRDLPIRYMEVTTDYRDEKTGELGGLSRVRSLTQDDSHVFCRQSQIEGEIQTLVGIVKELYATVGMSRLKARLSYRDDSDQYLGDKKLWRMAQAQIKQAAIDNGLEYFEAEGEAAFYGPKIDFMAEDAIGREHQVATVQLDFVMPQRFGLEFTNEQGEAEQPVMIHHATLGSIERFLSVFIEHTAGWFPLWCAPEQVRVLTINDTVEDYVVKITTALDELVLDEPLGGNKLRYTVDRRNESLGKKIREAAGMKIPVVLIVGPKDVEAGEVSVRLRDGEQKVKLAQLGAWLRKLG